MYKKWGKTFCPALNSDVYFTKQGWNHLFIDKTRSKIEILKRVKLLPMARKVVSETTTIQSNRLQDRGLVSHIHIVFVDCKFYGQKIEVVVVEDKKKYYFLSVCKV